MQSTGPANSSYITPCSEDEDGNLVITFPDELLEAMGWCEGTVLDISAIGGRIVLQEAREELDEQDSSSG